MQDCFKCSFRVFQNRFWRNEVLLLLKIDSLEADRYTRQNQSPLALLLVPSSMTSGIGVCFLGWNHFVLWSFSLFFVILNPPSTPPPPHTHLVSFLTHGEAALGFLFVFAVPGARTPGSRHARQALCHCKPVSLAPLGFS